MCVFVFQFGLEHRLRSFIIKILKPPAGTAKDTNVLIVIVNVCATGLIVCLLLVVCQTLDNELYWNGTHVNSSYLYM